MHFVGGGVLDAAGEFRLCTGDPNVDPGVFHGIAQGVCQQVLIDPVQLAALRPDDAAIQVGLQPDVPAGSLNGILHICQYLSQAHDRIQPGAAHILPAGRLGKIKYILYHPAQSLGFSFQHMHIVHGLGRQLLLGQQVNVADEGGQRRFQVVGHIGDQVDLGAFRLYLPGNGVPGAVLDLIQFPELCRYAGILRRGGRGEIPLADGVDSLT